MIPIWIVYFALFAILVSILVVNVKIYNLLKSGQSQRPSDPQKQQFSNLSFRDFKEK